MTEETQSPKDVHTSADEPQAILAAVDASPNGARVIALAARISRSMPEAALHVVHVLKASRLDAARKMGSPASNADAIEDAKEQLEYHVRSARKQSRAQVTGHFVPGDPATEVLRLANELHADLLVVGTHDYVGLERFLLGSVAETLMRKAPCPVLVVRPTSHRT